MNNGLKSYAVPLRVLFQVNCLGNYEVFLYVSSGSVDQPVTVEIGEQTATEEEMGIIAVQTSTTVNIQLNSRRSAVRGS